MRDHAVRAGAIGLRSAPPSHTLRTLPIRRWTLAWRLAPLLVLLVALAAPAVAAPQGPGTDPLADDADVMMPESFPDPLEPLNRLTFRMNLGLDRWVVAPVARAYAWAVPAPARRGIRRALTNLDSPAVFVNDVLQLHPVDAGVTVGRFALNTTVGLLGVLDPANALGLPPHQADFGQTLALAGVPSGPYLILPLAGPTTARDATGFAVDFLFRPTTYVLTPGAQIVWTSITEGSEGIAARDANGDALDALQASSLDFYAALRNAFYQDRTARIAARRVHPAWPSIAASGGMLAASRGQVGDLPADRGEQHLEPVARED